MTRIDGAPRFRGRHGAATALALTLLLAAACAARPAPPAVGAAEVDAARRRIAASPPPAAQPRPAEADSAMLASAAARVAAAAEPVCAAQLRRACGFSVRFAPSTTTARASAHGAGEVTITAGMVRLVETEDELAAVVAHEFGHHLAGHLGRQRTRGAVAGAVASAVLGALVPFGGLAGAALGQGAAELGAGAARLAYSKAEEREADYLAAYLVARAGYDLGRAGELWARLSRPDAAARAGGGIAGLLATHPAEAERLAAWQRAAEEIRASPDLMPRQRAGS
jgi:Zn-dependent protease with chaperone function